MDDDRTPAELATRDVYIAAAAVADMTRLMSAPTKPEAQPLWTALRDLRDAVESFRRLVPSDY